MLRTLKPSRLLSSYAVNDASHLGDALALDIPTVTLSFDKHSPALKPPSEKSPLIFLHGLFGCKSNTRSVARRLARDMARDVYCLDLRNFGLSPHHPRLDYPALLADVERFIDEQAFAQKPVVVGHSMGAKTAMALALRRPELPRIVVAVDNAPVCLGTSGPFGKYIRQLRNALEIQRYENIKDVDAALAQVEPAKEVRQFLLTNVARGARGKACISKIPLATIADAVQRGEIAAWPYDCKVVRWTRGPALFVRGIHSTYVPDEVLPAIGSYFPRFELRDVDAGHWLISEKPHDFIEILRDFVERKEDEEI